MMNFILRRLLAGVALIVAISIVAFVLLYAGAGDIARRVLGRNATAEIVAQKAVELGLDRPLPVQFAEWAGGAIRGDLGRSWFTSQFVTQSLGDRIGVTLSLVLIATAVGTIIAVLLGVIAARRGGWVDAVVQVFSVLAYSVPNFLIALALVVVFAINLHLFRATGYIEPTVSVEGWLASITLPVIALTTGLVASIAQQVRGSVIDVSNRDFVRTLRSRGLGDGRVVYKHVLRNAGGPALSLVGVQFIGLLGGAVIVEQVFGIPGLGQLAVQATSQGDVPVVMGVVIVTALIVVVVNLLIDLAQAALNPKVRLA